ncbi:Ring finger domain/Zinc finger C3HC4 type (RING finger) containing protein [Leishmania donovani]|uniref:Ring_finger_domain/Zinc_finger_C3HC4_type_(RING_f inger)_containing_protein_putative/Pfam:PF13639/Pfam:PF1392 3 n=1 Tax=Leishmania donovani TaxID=5661 RepID=A0A6J8F8F8_LEIDO|nr:Ring finger domain/Zinc finger C3HC4 type (RING finger) containing protein [Leishmania donovani]VDZ42374.1 Ring_finger_domain/Zinc_finger_C3HC4_type_(RING_finger)_containing_protein_putative/Pfam:PF13639/Pfam:PF13923 [Leishmania donovani]
MWVGECPDRIRKRISAAKKSRMVIKKLNDPTRFAVCDIQGKNHNCTIGNPHMCSCGATQPCAHTLSVLLLFFKVSEENPIVWQRYINEVELSDLIDKRADEGKCVFCHESTGSVGSCEKCGAHFHQLCLELASKSGKGNCNTCPKCREMVSRSESKSDTCCSNCSVPCKTENYTCLLCPDYFLCRRCYTLCKTHPSHPFSCSKLGGPAPSTCSVSPQSMGDLQYREINPEDYEALIALDNDKRRPLGEEELSNLPVEYFSACARRNDSCPVCLRRFVASNRCIALPCGHIMHHKCGFKWLSEFSDVCPIDNRKVCKWSNTQDARTAGEVKASLQASTRDGTTLRFPSKITSVKLPAIKPREWK